MRSLKYLFLFLFPFFSFAQSPIVGIWQGDIHFGKDSLAVVLVVENVQDTFQVVMDSPDQYMTDFPVSHFSFQNDSVNVVINSLNCRFTGRLTDSAQLVGTFTQGKADFALVMHKTDFRRKFLRPQTPQPPYPYSEKELTFQLNDRHSVLGTLTIPNTPPKAVVVMITGSGRQDRDESIFGHKPFKVIADFLTREGYAVFRYDDPPMTIFNKFTSYHFADQALAICDSLSLLPELKNVPMGLLGHSEGGLIAWMVASQNTDIQFVISLAGMGVPIQEILLYQSVAISRADSVPENLIDRNSYLNQHVYSIVQKAKDKESAAKALNDYILNYTKDMTNEQREEYHLTAFDIITMNQQLLSPWFFALFKIEPKAFIKKVRCPVMALNGSFDLQVEASTNLAAMKKYLKKNSLHHFETIPGVNHLFQECMTGSPSEYGDIEQTFAPQVLDKMVNWLNQLPFKK